MTYHRLETKTKNKQTNKKTKKKAKKTKSKTKIKQKAGRMSPVEQELLTLPSVPVFNL
jgi:DNA replication protein DnaD